MNGYSMSEIRFADKRALTELDELLRGEKIKRDPNLDYIVGLYDGDDRLAATGACFANTLRCLAVSDAHRGEGLLNRVVSHLIERQSQRGNVHLFLYTKADKARFFMDLGFYEIARTSDETIFMENQKKGFSSFLEELAADRKNGNSAALVMNCNPFTLGHRYLVERAAAQNDAVHLFVVSEDVSFFPFTERYAMIGAGCSDLRSVVLHETRSYMISNAVFPSYFLKDEEAAIKAQARLDLILFAKIAHALGVTRRYVGEEPFSRVTRVYNETMRDELPGAGLECVVVPRKAVEGQPISASQVRQMLHDGRLDAVRSLVPQSTFDYLQTGAGQRTVERLRAALSVRHY
ncbi:MAG: [citrate (pro-3S)-lyase] ligase [Synergistaceae bacterium]|nr:[citrate (pro-3S)-lyase] ligase [Synergistaceae bacterium]